MDSALGFGRRYALHPMSARLELKAGIDAVALHSGNDFFITALLAVASANNFYAPAALFRIAGVHAEEITRKDGRFITLGALEAHFWANFCAAVERPEWTERQHDPLPQTDLIAEAASLIGAAPLAHWQALLNDVDCCYYAVLNYAEARADPHVKARGLVTEGKSGIGVLFAAFVDGEGPEPRPAVEDVDLETALEIINHDETQVSREISQNSIQIQAFPSLHILLNHSVYIVQSLPGRVLGHLRVFGIRLNGECLWHPIEHLPKWFQYSADCFLSLRHGDKVL